MKKIAVAVLLMAFVTTPAMAELISSSASLQVSTDAYAGDISRLLDNRVPLDSSRALTGNGYDINFLGQSTGGGAGFLEDGAGDGSNFYNGTSELVGNSLLPGADVLTAQEFEVVSPASQPLAALQIQVQLTTTGADLLPTGFQFGPGQPIDLYRMDTGTFSGALPIDPDEGTFDVIDAFFVLFDSTGTSLGAFNMVNGTVAGTTGVSVLEDASIFGFAGDGVVTILQVWNITPEPATLALMGLGGMMLIRRRRA
ncbi:MAG: PEP-CTERM sorting domain-containing protein [Planctomycetes bacterium]|nr:PEP-CTERM sorting domain-containing protein [Planctomycetota bacterium]